MTETKQTARKTGAARRSATVWSDAERAAMQEAARERKAASRRDPEAERAEGEREVLEKIADMPEPDRALAERLHLLITAAGPSLAPRTWYGMPAYALDGNVVCHFQPAAKFKMRYVTLGFSDKAKLDDGAMWPIAFALTELTPAAEARIVELVKKGLG
jgi:uncharacterized protein YdhG (YjbR/CyaY superfamily)